MKLITAYVPFYLDGRDEKILKHDIDTDSIAEQVVAGEGTIVELLAKAATAAAEPQREGRRKRNWLEDEDQHIKDAGGDGEEAYRHYLQGRIDQLAAVLNDEVVDAMGDDGEGDEDDDEEESDEDDEDEDKK